MATPVSGPLPPWRRHGRRPRLPRAAAAAQGLLAWAATVVLLPPRAAALSVKSAHFSKIKPLEDRVRFVVLKDLSPQPFAFCAIPRNDELPWLRLMLRASKKYNWNRTLWDPELELSGERGVETVDDIDSFLADAGSSGRFLKAVVVRDPVTRVLSNFRQACMGDGDFAKCNLEQPAGFEDFLANLQKNGFGDSPLFKPQVDLCGMRSTKYELIGHHENLAADSKVMLQRAELWSSYGASGWNVAGVDDNELAAVFDDDFSVMFDNSGDDDESVCEYFTAEMIAAVKQLYDDDYKTFGYTTRHWLKECGAVWKLRDGNGQLAVRKVLPSDVSLEAPPIKTACAAPKHQLDALAGRFDGRLPEWSLDAMRFYLLQDGPFDFGDTIQCAVSAVGLSSKYEDRWDDHVFANSSEHVGELFLLRAFEEHPQRTTDASQAQLFVIGVPPFVSWLASRVGCGTLEDHVERMKRVASALLALPAFQRSGGSDFFIGTSHFQTNDIYTPHMLKLMNEGKILVGTADRRYMHWQRYPRIARRMITLPYKAHFAVEQSGWGDAGVNGERRKRAFVFRGRMSRQNEGASRKVLADIKDQLFNAEVEDVDVRNLDPNMTIALAQDYLHTDFCFVPAGDSPTSRRLFDALAAGCVPVMLGSVQSLRENLPFPNSIDWSRVAIFGGSLPCARANQTRTVSWLKSLSNLGTSSSLLQYLRRAGREVFLGVLSYSRAGQGMVKAILREVASADVGPLRLPRVDFTDLPAGAGNLVISRGSKDLIGGAEASATARRILAQNGGGAALPTMGETYLSLDGLSADEGVAIAGYPFQRHTLEECGILCSAPEFPRCRSFSFSEASGQCFLKDKCIDGTEAVLPSSGGFRTHYRPC